MFLIALPSVLLRCWLGGRKDIRPVTNMGGWWRWALVSPDGVAPSRMVSVSVSVNLPLHHKVHSLLAPAHPGGPRKRAVKRFWLWCGGCKKMFWQLTLPQSTKEMINLLICDTIHWHASVHIHIMFSGITPAWKWSGLFLQLWSCDMGPRVIKP